MAATGSNSSVAQDLFVPDARAMPMGPLFGGGHRSERNRDEPLYRYAVFPFLLSSSYGTPIGMAQGAMEAFLELVPGRTTSFEDPTPQAESPNAQLDVAEAAMEIESCLLLARRATGLIHERGVAGEPVTKAERVRARADVAFTTRRSLGVVRRLSAISGASSARLDAPIQRYLRDASTLANHAVLNYEANMTLLGKELLGLDPRTPFL
jgi:alkylation response protein AidB-like acyl-CoA dehydrogenase